VLCAYPTVSLLDARQRYEETHKLLAKDYGPGDVHKSQKAAKAESTAVAAETFEQVARDWMAWRKAQAIPQRPLSSRIASA